MDGASTLCYRKIVVCGVKFVSRYARVLAVSTVTLSPYEHEVAGHNTLYTVKI